MKKCVDDMIELRPISRGDTDKVLRWRNSRMVKSFFIYQKDISRKEHENWLSEKVAKGKVVQFIIFSLKDNIDIGSVYLQNIDYENKKCEFGIFIGEEYAIGRGYGRRATQLITEYAFDELGMNKVYLRVLADNQRAHKSYLNSGFKDEGYFKEDVWINGHPKDVIFMAKHANE